MTIIGHSFFADANPFQSLTRKGLCLELLTLIGRQFFMMTRRATYCEIFPPSITSGSYPDIGSADPLAFIRAHPSAPFFLHTLRVLISFLTRSISSAFFLLFLGICFRLLTRSNSRGYSREQFLASMRRASMRTFLPIPNARKKNYIKR